MGLRLPVPSRTAAATLLAALTATLSLSAAQGARSHPPSAGLAPDDQALVKRYCVSCHSDRLKTASLTLESISGEPIGSAPAVWEKVVRKIRSGAMPPAGRPRPDKAVKDAFAGRLEAALDENAAVSPNPGRTGCIG
jgi:mono/diheme cytochrome c family protein